MHRCLTLWFAVCGGLVSSVGCGKKPISDAAPQAGASAAAASAVATDSARQPTAPAPQNPRDFGAMFANEAANRPTGTIKAEDAMAAFRKDGITLDTVRQHLGRPYGAR